MPSPELTVAKRGGTPHPGTLLPPVQNPGQCGTIRPVTDSERLDALCTYAEQCGWHVEFEPAESECDGRVRLLVIDSRQKIRTQVYELLHELGHMLDDDCSADRLIPASQYASLTATGRVAELECELNAWKRGWQLARKLQLGIDRRAYQRAAVLHLKTFLTQDL